MKNREDYTKALNGGARDSELLQGILEVLLDIRDKR